MHAITGVIQGGTIPPKFWVGGRHIPYPPPHKLSAQLRKITICLDNLSELCEDNYFIFVQEHGLLKSLLWKFDLVHKDFVFDGCSAMDSVCSEGLLRCGRTFGGVGILHRKNLSAKLFVVAYHSEGTCVAVTLDYGNLAYIYYVLVSICPSSPSSTLHC